MKSYTPNPKGVYSLRRLLVAVLFFSVLMIIGIIIADSIYARDRIYPGVRIGEVPIGGTTVSDARALLDQAFKTYSDQHFDFVTEGQKISVPIREVVSLDAEAALQNAPALWTTGPLWARLLSRLDLRLRGGNMSPLFTIHENVLTTLLRDGFSEKQHLPQEARFIVSFPKEEPHIEIQEGIYGTTVNIEKVRELLLKRVALLSLTPIPLEMTTTAPTLRAVDLEPLTTQAEALLRKPAQELTVGTNHWKITPQLIASWLTAEIQDGEPVLSFDKSHINEWLLSLAHEIDRPAINAVLEISPDGKKATKFNIGTPGIKFQPNEDEIVQIAARTMQGKSTTLTAQIIDPPRTSSAEAANFGIKELVGSGTTSFKGSPPNRIKNIKRGATLLNNALIAPGEEFSVLDNLRPFTLENGYLPELVIKAAEGKTVPEIGGGLCQIGTTMFRAVLNAGLPITARANHSYRVSYYEPPVGMDATIYDPAPDFKFVNDTGNWLLLTTEVSGTNLTFALWGTKDGRTAVSSTPEISNLKQPPEKKTIETLDLPVGKTKCTEHAHVGSDARFTYTVTYPDGTIKEREFKSRYRPWQEVCLIGVEKLTEIPETIPDQNATAPAPSDTLPLSDTLGVVGDNNNPAPN